MWELLSSLFILGVYTSASPIGLIAELVVLRTGVRQGFAFACGWTTALTFVTVASGRVLFQQDKPVSSGTKTGILVFELLIGVAVLLIGLRMLQKERALEQGREEPKFLSKLENIKPISAFFAGTIVATYPPAILAGSELYRSDVRTGARLFALLMYIFIGSIVVFAPVIMTLRSPEARQQLNSVYAWTVAKRQMIAAYVLVLLGALVTTMTSVHLVLA